MKPEMEEGAKARENFERANSEARHEAIQDMLKRAHRERMGLGITACALLAIALIGVIGILGGDE